MRALPQLDVPQLGLVLAVALGLLGLGRSVPMRLSSSTTMSETRIRFCRVWSSFFSAAFFLASSSILRWRISSAFSASTACRFNRSSSSILRCSAWNSACSA